MDSKYLNRHTTFYYIPKITTNNKYNLTRCFKITNTSFYFKNIKRDQYYYFSDSNNHIIKKNILRRYIYNFYVTKNELKLLDVCEMFPD